MGGLGGLTGEGKNQSARPVKQRRQSCLWPFIDKKKKKKKEKNVFSKVASRWHSTFGLKGRETEQESRAERGGERDLSVSFVFLVD